MGGWQWLPQEVKSGQGGVLTPTGALQCGSDTVGSERIGGHRTLAAGARGCTCHHAIHATPQPSGMPAPVLARGLCPILQTGQGQRFVLSRSFLKNNQIKNDQDLKKSYFGVASSAPPPLKVGVHPVHSSVCDVPAPRRVTIQRSLLSLGLAWPFHGFLMAWFCRFWLVFIKCPICRIKSQRSSMTTKCGLCLALTCTPYSSALLAGPHPCPVPAGSRALSATAFPTPLAHSLFVRASAQCHLLRGLPCSPAASPSLLPCFPDALSAL